MPLFIFSLLRTFIPFDSLIDDAVSLAMLVGLLVVLEMLGVPVIDWILDFVFHTVLNAIWSVIDGVLDWLASELSSRLSLTLSPRNLLGTIVNPQ